MEANSNSSETSSGTDSDPVVQIRTDGECPSESVIKAVSEATGTDPLRMQPLHTAIDTDALDTIFNTTSSRTRQYLHTRVTFQFTGWDVVVHGDGRTVVSRPDTD
jgi:hypothetical protein